MKKIGQYLSLNNSESKIKSVLKRNEKNKVVTILDLEDSLIDSFDANQTIINRVKGRKLLPSILKDFKHYKHIGIRINAIYSDDYQKDKQVLNLLNDINWELILLPMVRCGDINKFFKDFPSCPPQSLRPIIETQDAVKNLDSIIAEAKSNNVTSFDVGGADLFLDLNIFPHPRQNTIQFWDTFEPIIRKINNAGIIYGHTPFNDLLNHELFYQAIQKIDLLTDSNFEVRTLTNGQSRSAKNFNNGIHKLEIVNDNNNKTEYALELVNSFKRGDYSFSINSNYFFITPHEFISAKKFLVNVKEKH